MQATIHPINVHDASLNTENSVNNRTEIYGSLQFLPAMKMAFLNIKKVFCRILLAQTHYCKLETILSVNKNVFQADHVDGISQSICYFGQKKVSLRVAFEKLLKSITFMQWKGIECETIKKITFYLIVARSSTLYGVQWSESYGWLASSRTPLLCL